MSRCRELGTVLNGRRTASLPCVHAPETEECCIGPILDSRRCCVLSVCTPYRTLESLLRLPCMRCARYANNGVVGLYTAIQSVRSRTDHDDGEPPAREALPAAGVRTHLHRRRGRFGMSVPQKKNARVNGRSPRPRRAHVFDVHEARNSRSGLAWGGGSPALATGAATLSGSSAGHSAQHTDCREQQRRSQAQRCSRAAASEASSTP